VGEPVVVEAEPTPNPNSYKFTVNRPVAGNRGQTFRNPDEAALSPLAQRLFEVPGVRSLFFLKDFITVARLPDADWDAILAGVEQVIRSFYEAQPRMS
jgi:hypothetical protein